MDTEVIYQELCNARREFKRGGDLPMAVEIRRLRRIAWLYRLFLAASRSDTAFFLP